LELSILAGPSVAGLSIFICSALQVGISAHLGVDYLGALQFMGLVLDLKLVAGGVQISLDLRLALAHIVAGIS